MKTEQSIMMCTHPRLEWDFDSISSDHSCYFFDQTSIAVTYLTYLFESIIMWLIPSHPAES